MGLQGRLLKKPFSLLFGKKGDDTCGHRVSISSRDIVLCTPVQTHSHTASHQLNGHLGLSRCVRPQESMSTPGYKLLDLTY